MVLDNGIRIQYLGHSTFHLTTPAGNTVVIDPWLRDNPSCPPEFHQLDRVETILLSHGHADHIGDVVSLARQHGPSIGCIYELATWLRTQGIKNVSGMNKGGTQQLNDLRVTMVDAKHSSSFQDEDGRLIYLGEPAGYIIQFENGFRLYFAGDTCVFGDMQLIAQLYRPDLACLPIGDFYTMGPLEAAHACRLLGTKMVIPMHYGTFPLLTGTPDRLRQLTADLGTEVIALKPGEILE